MISKSKQKLWAYFKFFEYKNILSATTIKNIYLFTFIYSLLIVYFTTVISLEKKHNVIGRYLKHKSFAHNNKTKYKQKH